MMEPKPIVELQTFRYPTDDKFILATSLLSVQFKIIAESIKEVLSVVPEFPSDRWSRDWVGAWT